MQGVALLQIASDSATMQLKCPATPRVQSPQPPDGHMRGEQLACSDCLLLLLLPMLMRVLPQRVSVRSALLWPSAGASSCCSSHALHNEILRRRPDLYEVHLNLASGCALRLKSDINPNRPTRHINCLLDADDAPVTDQ